MREWERKGEIESGVSTRYSLLDAHYQGKGVRE
jgi:hypothetical protein